MKGIAFAIAAGVLITLQGVAITRTSEAIGTWQAAAVTQLGGFLTALTILLILRGVKLQSLKRVSPLYLSGGLLAAVIIYGNVEAMHRVGVTITMAAALIAQLTCIFIIDSNGWFGLVKQRVGLSHIVGIGMMLGGVVLMTL